MSPKRQIKDISASNNEMHLRPFRLTRKISFPQRCASYVARSLWRVAANQFPILEYFIRHIALKNQLRILYASPKKHDEKITYQQAYRAAKIHPIFHCVKGIPHTSSPTHNHSTFINKNHTNQTLHSRPLVVCVSLHATVEDRVSTVSAHRNSSRYSCSHFAPAPTKSSRTLCRLRNPDEFAQ